jgi:hypothetical protein
MFDVRCSHLLFRCRAQQLRESTVGILPIASCLSQRHSIPMHHLRSYSVIVRFRLAALLWFAICLLIPVAAGLLFGSLWTGDFKLTMAGSSLALLSLGLVIPQWAAGSRTACPLCWTPVLAPKNCVKHRRARSFIGSHRLRVAMAILFKNKFCCPYCNESTTLVLRDTLHHPMNRWSQLD